MYFRQASVTLSEIIKQPGIWDPFVLSYITVRRHLTLSSLKMFLCLNFFKALFPPDFSLQWAAHFDVNKKKEKYCSINMLSCVSCLLQMLEHNNSIDEALKVLQNYAYNKEFPSNPNAHVYLYQFLKRHNAPPSALISSLRVWDHYERLTNGSIECWRWIEPHLCVFQILHSVVPSHKLMLDFCSLLLKERTWREINFFISNCVLLYAYVSFSVF